MAKDMNTRRLSAASLGHFSIDILNSSVAMILVHIAGRFDLSISQIGFGAMVYTLFAALTQPLFGILADHMKGRWLAALGVAWTASFYALAAFMPSYPALLTCLAIGAWGSAAFHADGMVNAGAAGGTRHPTLTTSIFFVCGQAGLAVGPFIAGLYLERIGLVGMPVAAAATVPVVVLMLLWMRQPIASSNPGKPGVATPAMEANVPKRHAAMLIVAIFVMLIALRATTAQSFATLLPKFYDDQGIPSSIYGQMIGVFAFCGALGTFLGGFLGDRFNRRIVIFIATMLSVPFCIGLLNSSGWLFFLTAGVAGALLNVPHSIILIMAQQLLPRRKGMAGGLVLGFMFASGAVGAWVGAWFADRIGLYTVLSLVAFLPLGAGLCALLLPSTRTTTVTIMPVKPSSAAAD